MTISTVLLGILGGQELLFILVIVLVLFGGKKIPELMRGLGKGVGEYNKAKTEVWDQIENKEDSKEPKKESSSEKTDKP
jgi:sec-independent protein translocase protein TatA